MLIHVSFRLYSELKPGSLLAVLERLQLAGQSPRPMIFNTGARAPNSRAFYILTGER
jgi:hypothetical protein